MQSGTTTADIGKQLIRSGLTQFFLGFLLGFVPILHYFHGAVAGDVGPTFLKNMTLWWGCPAVLMEYVLKTGGLGMAAVGLCYTVFAPSTRTEVSGPEQWAPTLCHCGLTFAAVWMAVGYVAFNRIWPNFYFEPVPTGKNMWLGGQLAGIVVYVYGITLL